MAAREGVEGEQRHLVDGHVIEYNFQLGDFFSRLPFSFERSFTIDCSVAPTSWMFIVNFERTPGENIVACQVALRRTDDRPRKVDVSFSIRPFSDIVFERPTSLQQSESSTDFSRLMRFAAVGRTPQGGVLLQMFFTIQMCHPE